MKLVGIAVLACTAFVSAAMAGQIAPAKGWKVIDTKLPFATLVQQVDAAVVANKMAVVNAASASEGAKAQGFTIPGNKVVGVYRNDFARRMLTASVSAGIEAPIRIYLVENPDGGSTLAYRPPSTVFAPYFSKKAADLKAVAGELDVIFAKIAADATMTK